MTRLARLTLALPATLLLATACPGCRDSKSQPAAEGPKPAPSPAPAATGAKPPPAAVSARKDASGKPLPADEVDVLLNDLSGTELQRSRLPSDARTSWLAEDKLIEIGPAIAPRVRAALSFPSPEARAAACRLACRFEDAGAVPALIGLLGDESLLVRTHANRSLCTLTGQDLGYRPGASPEDRAAARARWERWYASTTGPVAVPKRP